MGIGAVGAIGNTNVACGFKIKNHHKISADEIKSIEENNINIFTGNKNCISNIDEEKLKQSVDKLNELLKKKETYIKIEKHDVFKNTFIIKIIEKKTENVIKEIPPKKILDMVASMCEMAGLILDEKA